MALPPYMLARTPAAMHRVLAAADGGRVPGADFTPAHLLVDEVDGVVLDTNRADPWDLVSEGRSARRGRSAYGSPSFVAQTLEHVRLGHRYKAKRVEAFNFGVQSWSLLMPVRYDVGADTGALCMGNVRGPRPEDPWYGSTQYGEDRGWAVSWNGDGGFGGVMYGPVANSANWINMDTVFGTYNAADGRWRMFEVGYNAAAKTMWATMAKRLDEGGGIAYCAQATAAGPGDITSPDRFVTGMMQYGVEASGFDGAYGLPWAVFLGANALSRWLSRLEALPVLQYQLEACE